MKAWRLYLKAIRNNDRAVGCENKAGAAQKKTMLLNAHNMANTKGHSG
jgi:hypothetical protein